MPFEDHLFVQGKTINHACKSHCATDRAKRKIRSFGLFVESEVLIVMVYIAHIALWLDLASFTPHVKS